MFLQGYDAVSYNLHLAHLWVSASFQRVNRVRHCKVKNSRVDTQANTVAIYSKCYALCKAEYAILHAPGSTEGLSTSASQAMWEQWLLFGIEEKQCPQVARIVQVYPNLMDALGFYVTSWGKALCASSASIYHSDMHQFYLLNILKSSFSYKRHFMRPERWLSG